MGKYSAARDLNLANNTRWYVVASRTDAAIYKDGPDQKFQVVDRFSNAKGALLESEMVSDRQGRVFSTGGGGIFHHTLDRRDHHHELAARRFAKKIAKVIMAAYQEHRMGNVVLVAEPHFLGLLRNSLSPFVRRIVEHEVRHHYAGSDADLRRQILSAIGVAESSQMAAG